MQNDERNALAAVRADRYAPEPTGGRLMAGVCGGALGALAVLVWSRFYRLSIAEHPLLTGGAVLLSFAAGVLVFSRLARLSRRARRSERDLIDAEQDGRSD